MGCLRNLIVLLLIAALAVAVYFNRDRLRSGLTRARYGGAPIVAPTPTKELADAADAELEKLRSGAVAKVALSELELQSLLLYKYRELLPEFVGSPRVELRGDKIFVRARLPVDRLPQLNELGEAAALLPDTTEVSVLGGLLPLSSGRVALAVDQVRAARIPLPHRLVPGALRQLGRKEEAGLPDDALAVPLPPGANAAYVRGDSLFFLASGRRPRN